VQHFVRILKKQKQANLFRKEHEQGGLFLRKKCMCACIQLVRSQLKKNPGTKKKTLSQNSGTHRFSKEYLRQFVKNSSNNTTHSKT
jgi:hypothetical protein